MQNLHGRIDREAPQVDLVLFQAKAEAILSLFGTLDFVLYSFPSMQTTSFFPNQNDRSHLSTAQDMESCGLACWFLCFFFGKTRVCFAVVQSILWCFFHEQLEISQVVFVFVLAWLFKNAGSVACAAEGTPTILGVQNPKSNRPETNLSCKFRMSLLYMVDPPKLVRS